MCDFPPKVMQIQAICTFWNSPQEFYTFEFDESPSEAEFLFTVFQEIAPRIKHLAKISGCATLPLKWILESNGKYYFSKEV